MHSHGQEGKVNHPRFPEFKPITIEDQKFIEEFITKYPSEACEVIFGNLFIWRNYEHARFTTVNDNLCIFCEPPSEPQYFLQPIGENRMKETVKAINIPDMEKKKKRRINLSFIVAYLLSSIPT